MCTLSFTFTNLRVGQHDLFVKLFLQCLLLLNNTLQVEIDFASFHLEHYISVGAYVLCQIFMGKNIFDRISSAGLFSLVAVPLIYFVVNQFDLWYRLTVTGTSVVPANTISKFSQLSITELARTFYYLNIHE